jgi:hypothetical protein
MALGPGPGLGLSRRLAALRAARKHHGRGQDEEEERCSPRQHRAKRCTCLSRIDVTVLPARDPRSVTMAQAEEEAVGRGRAGASARAEYERREARALW